MAYTYSVPGSGSSVVVSSKTGVVSQLYLVNEQVVNQQRRQTHAQVRERVYIVCSFSLRDIQGRMGDEINAFKQQDIQ